MSTQLETARQKLAELLLSSGAVSLVESQLGVHDLYPVLPNLPVTINVHPETQRGPVSRDDAVTIGELTAEIALLMAEEMRQQPPWFVGAVMPNAGYLSHGVHRVFQANAPKNHGISSAYIHPGDDSAPPFVNWAGHLPANRMGMTIEGGIATGAAFRRAKLALDSLHLTIGAHLAVIDYGLGGSQRVTAEGTPVIAAMTLMQLAAALFQIGAIGQGLVDAIDEWVEETPKYIATHQPVTVKGQRPALA